MQPRPVPKKGGGEGQSVVLCKGAETGGMGVYVQCAFCVGGSVCLT